MDTGFKERVRPRYVDPFNPILVSSESLNVSEEQRSFIRKILDDACSDSFYAIKAYAAIDLVLTKGSILTPEITSLSPATAVIGDEPFDIHVHGTGFVPGAKIIFNGYEEPTTFVSETELTTGINMPLWEAPVVVAVQVSNTEGVMSNPMMFEFLSPVQSAQSDVKERHELLKEFIEQKSASGANLAEWFDTSRVEPIKRDYGPGLSKSNEQVRADKEKLSNQSGQLNLPFGQPDPADLKPSHVEGPSPLPTKEELNEGRNREFEVREEMSANDRMKAYLKSIEDKKEQ